MKFEKYFILFLGLFFVFIFFFINIKTERDKNKGVEFLELCLKQHCFDVEVAKTKEERMLGLMYREELPQKKGIFLIFEDERVQQIWMKNVLIPLDIVWINSDLEIVLIEEDVPPCREEPCRIYKNRTPALYVLELNAGKIKETGVKEGDKVFVQMKNN